MSTVKDKVANAADSVADAAKSVGQKIKEGASEAAAFVKEKAGIGCDPKGESAGVNGIRERMDVYASCGKKVGVVDHLEGSEIKLTRKDSADGKHHFVPTSWVGRVHENHVHLTRNSAETERDWKTESASSVA
jgi:hypothetical protein